MNAHPRPVQQLAAAVALAMLQIGAAHAQAQAQTTAAGATAAVPATDTLNLDKVIVTGTSQGTSKMKTSVSVSTLDGDQILQSGAVSAAEVLRSIPGLRSESSGGESNANVGVRGIPISAGGARYIQFQEDGLPVLQFGDIAFATPDSWLRVDSMLDRLEVVRGGSASTLVTGAPGGIINFISKTGEDKGGSIALTKGLDYSHTRFDFDYGGRLAEKTRFQIGGFYRNGDGGRPGAAHTEDGGQIRGNITQELDNGFVRVSFKHLDDRTPTFLPTPVRFVAGQIQEIPGIDPRRAAFYNAGWPLDNTLTNSNGRATSNIRDGLVSKTDAFGVQMEFNLAGGWKLQDNFRWSKNSGRFVGIFPGSDVSAAPAGTRFATGANAGSAYIGDRFEAVVFNTKVDDAGLAANDFKLSKEFDLGAGKLTATGGLYTSMQQLKLTWNFNQYSLSASDEGARLLDVPGLANGSPGFGGCCMNFQDSKYRTTAPYAILAYEAGALNLDASVRSDRNFATGSYYQTLTGFGGLANGVAYNLARPRLIDYNFDNTSYSLGANFRITPNLALFARYSDGAAYNADRITFFNDPNLVNGSAAVIPTNEVRQFEGGAKWRSGGLSLFATFFAAKTEEIKIGRAHV